MPKAAKEMSALDVKRLKYCGSGTNLAVAVGGVSGLLLQITPNQGRSWVLRMRVAGKRRELGLGSYPDVSLSQARDAARKMKDLLRQGIDPVEQRNEEKAAIAVSQLRNLTFAQAVETYLEARLDEFGNAKHRAQWQSTLSSYAVPYLGQMLVDDIKVQDVRRVLDPIWLTKTETAKRVRGRIEAVLSWATVAGHRSGDNPARWNGNLKELFPAPSKVAKISNHPALQIGDAPRWFAALHKREGMGARALELAALTASRSQEVRGARWSEFDLTAAIWAVPANRMKMDREHRVPLTDEVISLLNALPRSKGIDLVFPAPRGGMLSDMTLSAAMKRLHEADIQGNGIGFIDRVNGRPAVPHGLRSTFRDWVAERTHFPGDMAEVALAHKVGNAVEAAYRRGDMVEKRRTMMAAWAGYLMGNESAGAEIIRIG